MAFIRVWTGLADVSGGAPIFDTGTTYRDSSRVAGALRLTNGRSFFIQHDQSTTNDTWYHFRHGQDNSANTALDILDFLLIETPTGFNMFRWEILNSQWRFHLAGDGTSTSGLFVPSVATVYSIDIQITVNGATDITLNVYINSTLFFNATQPNTNNQAKPNSMTWLNNDSFGNFYMSEGIIANEDTRGFRVRELTPTAFGVDQAWAGTANDVVDNDLGTGVSTATNDARVSFGVSNLQNVSPGDIINRVVAQTYAQRGASGLTRFNHYFRYPDNTRQDAAAQTLQTTGQWFIDEFLTNPKTAASWVPADLTGIQIGLRGLT